MTRKLDLISITGLAALAGIIGLLYAVYDLSQVPPAPSLFGMITGYVLVASMIALWTLPIFGRRGRPRKREGYKTVHRALGVAFLVLLAIHARSAGHAMLFGLMAMTLVMTLFAFFHAKVQTVNNAALLAVWWLFHVGLAAAISVMAILHIYAQYAYSTSV